AVAKSSGAVKITMVDVDQHRLNFAKNYVADEIILAAKVIGEGTIEYSERFSKSIIREFGIEQADVVLECSGVECSTQTGIYMTKPGGTFVQIGMGSENVTLQLSDIAIREITIKGSFRYCNTYKKAVEM
ncbi:3659_t:CDS:2, partial [Acaulospora colombiana]